MKGVSFVLPFAVLAVGLAAVVSPVHGQKAYDQLKSMGTMPGKVPDVPAPTPVYNSTGTASGFSVGNSSTTAKGASSGSQAAKPKGKTGSESAH
jgi:hypothetical protein